MRRRFAIAIAFAVLSLGGAPVATGHVRAESAASTGSQQVDIALSSPAESAFLTATGGSVTRHADDHYRLAVRALQPTVDVLVLSRDGHVTRIHVTGADSATPVVSTHLERDPLLAIVGRLLVLGALIGIVGSLAVARWIVLPGLRHPLRRLGQAETAPDPGVESALTTAVRRTWAIATAVGGLGLVLGVAAILIRLRSANLPMLLASTRTGHATLLVLAAVAICAVIAVRATPFQLERRSAPIGAATSAVALIAISAAGHATAGRDALLGGAFDAAHMLATAIWIGGLVVLLAVWRALRSAVDDTTAGRLGAIVVRFSGVAVACVATLAVTGTYRALAELGSFGDLIDTPYGRSLTVKLILFGLLLVMGGVNRFVVHPRLERAGIGLSDSDRGAARLLGPSVRIELALAAAVLLAVAVMIGFPPPG